MKLANKPDDLEKKGVKQLKKFYKTYEEFASCSMTWMSSLHLIIKFIVENYADKVEELPQEARYAIALGMYHQNILGMMIRGDVKPEEFQMKYMPIEKDAWEGKKLEERYIMIVKQLYKDLKKEGKI